MRILVLSDGWPPASQGGAERVAGVLTRELALSGDVVAVAICAAPEANGVGIQSAGDRPFDIFPIRCRLGGFWRPLRGVWNPWAVSELREILQTFRPDVIHAHNVHGGLSYHSLAISAESAPVVVTLHDAMSVADGKVTRGIGPDVRSLDPSALRIPLGSGWIRSLKKFARGRELFVPFRPQIARRYLRRSASALVAVSESHRELLRANGLDGVSVIHNGLDPDEWSASEPEVSALRQRLDLEGRPVILFGGRVSRLKGAEELMHALPMVVAAIPSVVLVIAGQTNAYTDRLRQRACENGLEGNVRFAGWLDGADLVAAYGASKVVVVPSICFETFSMVTLEAMAAQKPVVATCFGGPSEIVVDGETGYLVNPLRTSEMANALIALLRDANTAVTMGRAGHRRVVAEFSLAKMRDGYRELYRDVRNRNLRGYR